MREIIFRGKRVDNGEWVEGRYYKRTDYYGYPSIKHYIIVSTEDLGYDQAFEYYEVIPETVGPLTGLTDKNSKKIFEGDVVKTEFGRLCIVVWFSSPTFCGWDLVPVNTVENCVRTKPPTTANLFNPDCLEIVGNIYDNSEFSEVKK